MQRRIPVLAAIGGGALAALLALPVYTSAQRRLHDPSVLAADAHAGTTAAQPLLPGGGGAMPSLAPLVKQLRPVVVNVNSRFKPHRPRVARRSDPRQDNGDDQGDDEPTDPMEEFLRQFGGRRPDTQRERYGLGSGFLIGDGYVLTNHHVVMVPDENARGKQRPMDEITVITDELSPVGAREFPAKVVGADDKSDIALLRIEGKEVGQLRGAQLGDSDALEVGDYVVAIGEPFGLKATVTSGIVSAKERTQVNGPYSDYLQTDASINPGNSGGPLFNLRGEVIGVNSAIIQGANSVGFAIPIAVVKQILPQLKEKGRVSRGFLGVQPQAITQDMVDQFGLRSTKGALVADVVKESPASKAGLKPGDVITTLNGRPVVDNYQLTRDVGAVQPGQTVRLDVLRQGKPVAISVKLDPRPEDNESAPKLGQGEKDKRQGDPLGLQVETLTPELAKRARVDDDTRGVVVTDVAPDSSGGGAGIEPGDVILEANRQPVATVADYRRVVKGLKKGDTLLLRLRRGQATQFVPLKVK